MGDAKEGESVPDARWMLAHDIGGPLTAALLELDVAIEIVERPPELRDELELREALADMRSALLLVRDRLAALRDGGPTADASSATDPVPGADAGATADAIRPDASPRGRSPRPGLGSVTRRRRPRILVVDDEPLLAAALGRILARHYDVLTTTRAEDALGQLRAGVTFDVILSDLMMPEVSGMELYARVSAEFPEHAPRVMFLTGGAFTPRAREFLATVANPVLEKPIDRDGLLAAIAERIGAPGATAHVARRGRDAG